ncbi:hypothetical protein I6F65_13445 [Pseudoalteromonas sp. SWXJZ94C]|uniref:hypothetical protein n=1 Tax=unclassified Pseudoalteromonas TaxID=194690 RepID=UPI001407E04D|nr:MULTISPECIES: hypothetical protein [unclassified Pseudoalteromonas]MBH0057966.1 hypothetical protein [Pseudoalteromonas sp. SWXJZ94C]
MKNFLKKLGSPSAFCHFKYHLTTESVVSKTEKKKPKVTLATACLIDRNLFWATTRTYENTPITEIKNIIQAEKIQLPPMEGGFFWSIDKLSSNQFTISYFVVPESILDKIPEECRVVIPLYSASDDTEAQPLLITHAKPSFNYENQLSKINWLQVIGLFLSNKKADNKPEKLSNRKLLIAVGSIFSITAVLLSVYLMVAINHYQGIKTHNETAVNAVLSERQNRIKEIKLTSDFIKFLEDNPNVLNKLSLINIDAEGVFIERVKLITKGVEIFGTSENSATKVLEQIIKTESVKEAKFSRAVTKNKTGSESFTIEVTWK